VTVKKLDDLIRRVDARIIKKTGHRMTQDEIDLIKAGYRAAKLEFTTGERSER
jgi:hypothetical protein